MSLRQNAAVIEQASSGPRCGVLQLREELTGDDVAWLDEVLNDKRRQSTWIAAVLKQDGHQISAITLQRHRRGICSCR